MNERIKELVGQAKFMAEESINKQISANAELNAFAEKFAELIVRECVGIVNKIVPPGYEDYPDYRDQIEQSFRRECAVEIKQHFGVK